MRASEGIVAIGLLSVVACGGSRQSEAPAGAEATRQAPAEQVSVLAVDGMT